MTTSAATAVPTGAGSALTGVMLADAPGEVALARARAADRAGLESFHLADIGMDGDDQWPLLGALACITERIRLGLVTNPYTRRPAVTANAVRTLHELSGGRAFVCFARGGDRILASQGATAERPLTAIREAIELTRRICPGATTWIATKGPQTMELAARVADGVVLSGIPHGLLPEIVAGLRRTAERPLRISLSIPYGGGEEVADGGRARVALELGNMRPEYREAAGVPLDLIERVSAVLFGGGTLDEAARLVPDDVVRRFALVAPPDQVAARLAHLRTSAGLDVVEISSSALFTEDGTARIPELISMEAL
ncbi:LLM class flavin-dependent oxidoreductase [Nocardioides sp. L-11A]|uniref:LLM class flavin-dependent oxidoreductase n=1 Tax=Nocardioides sp. L-11A TaxID=3043848 RepID=UPI00249A7F25|nr:LLM class flavin-dependent oxidoreductase [Nocardioides sp. L-11A]